jgi:hypothetical protein
MSCRNEASLSMGDHTGDRKDWLAGVERTGTVVSIVVFIGVFFFFELLGSPS